MGIMHTVLSNGGGSWGKINSPVNLCLQDSTFIIRMQPCWTTWPECLGTVGVWWLKWKHTCYQPTCQTRGSWKDICLRSTEMWCYWHHCCCWKLYTWKIIGVFVLHLTCGSSKVFGTVGEVCCFLYELILCKHSTTPVGHLALACGSLQRTKEVDNEMLMVYCHRISLSSR